MIRAVDASFLTTAVDRSGYPPPIHPEVAFVGRSNVGKSSMINALVNRRGLVRVSNTPGRTRALNFFDVEIEVGRRRHRLRLVDLPGYGFAKVSKDERAQWDAMISAYLQGRPALRAVVAIVDAKVGATEDDVRTLRYLAQQPVSILVAATKLDRLAKAHRKPALAEVAQALGVPKETVIGFSATEKLGLGDLWSTLWNAIETAPQPV